MHPVGSRTASYRELALELRKLAALECFGSPRGQELLSVAARLDELAEQVERST